MSLLHFIVIMEPLVVCSLLENRFCYFFFRIFFLKNTGWDGVNCSVKFTFVSVDQNILRG